MKIVLCASMICLAMLATSASATVLVTSPANGVPVGTNVQYTATASTWTCRFGIAAMGVYIDDELKYVSNGATLNTTLRLDPGVHKSVVQSWDFCGAATTTLMSVKVNTQSSVSVVTPVDGSTVGPTVGYIASAVTDCAKGVSGMGIFVNDVLTYIGTGSTLNAQIALNRGNQKTVVQAWDFCGGYTTTPVNLTVTGTTYTNLQAWGGWNGWGELPPIYDICDGPCPGVDWSIKQHVSSPSLSGDAAQFYLGGTTPYSDALWSLPLIGHGAAKNLADESQKLLPTIHHLIYDTYVYVTDFSITQDLEFDINMFMDGVGMEWGTECNHLDSGAWDYWNNIDAQWVPTTIPCKLKENAWNHVVLQAERLKNNDLHYQTLTVNDQVYNLDLVVAPFPVPKGWYGMTANYQMDGNYRQAPNTTYLDNLNVTYW